MGRKRRNNVYRHYMLQEESQTSTCLLCYKTLNTTHGSNLMNHLKFMHKTEYQQIVALNSGSILSIATPPRDLPNSIMGCDDGDDDPLNFSKLDDEDSNHSEPWLEVDVEKFFTTDRLSSRARCDICQASVDLKGNSLITHLKREHPKILKPANDDSDAAEPDELYQEIVYLYDSDSKSPKNVRPLNLPSSTPMSSRKQKAMQSARQFKRPSISLENRKRPRIQESATSPPVDQFTEELENFGKYVTCLMKTVPEDLCTQLQMDIINLIMTAKIKNRSKSEASTSQKLDGVSTGTFDQSIMDNVDASRIDTASLPSPESNMGEMKTDVNG